ncbi:MAG TPA: hydroxymethylglutaryl-CoA reductase, degradative, partial [Polyangiaceae bacterium]|nr:hydroxymethylglutaryl-CoA reductase, degradative [Polyangiaceae bacterium]
LEHLARGGGLDVAVADTMSENVLATFALPLSVALNFVVNERELVVPMATEEPSVVAAASFAARMIRETGGFRAEADEPVMTAQIQLDQVADPERAHRAIEGARGELAAAVDAAVPGIVARGGGFRDLELRSLGEGFVVVHVHVDVRDAMGANAIDTVAEALADRVAALAGGRVGLRILTNLCVRRRVRVAARVRAADVGGRELADAVARASRFAELDPYRAATHNKGFMNGVDAAAIALGQDFRALEAGAHAFAATGGAWGTRSYAPLAVWRSTEEGLFGSAELPMAVGTVGGSCRAHEGVKAAFSILGTTGAKELAMVLASVGLASNLAALRALAGEGIQRGHMRLHAKKSVVDVRPSEAARDTVPTQERRS